MMHPRNRYNTKPDFRELAEFHPPLKAFLIPKTTSKHTAEQSEPLASHVGSRDGESPSASASESQDGESPGKTPSFHYTLDFSNTEALCELSQAVLAKDFNLDVHLPLDKLVPAVPQRLNYIHWVEDLLGLYEGMELTKNDGHVIGIDIGTGASCIYPLLATRMNGWCFLATDIDKESVSIAQENVSRNGLSDKIRVVEVSPDVVLREVLDPSVPQYTFCMCNPPFFKDHSERLVGVASGRRPHAKTFSSASEGEAITHGGEVEFVGRIIKDSVSLKDRVRWYTTMLGKKASLKPLLSQLKELQVPVTTSTEFVQGRTWRWGLAWSFDTMLKDKVSALNEKTRKRKERPLVLRLPLCEVFSTDAQTAAAGEWIEAQLKELNISYEFNGTLEEGKGSYGVLTCHTSTNTWSHQRKRRRIMEHLEKQKKELRDKLGISGPSTKEQSITTGQDTDTQCVPKTDSTSKAASEQHPEIKALEEKASSELKALSTPCSLKFTCEVRYGCHKEVSPKKRKVSPKDKRKKLSEGQASMEEGLYAEFQLLEGEHKDELHQIVQYMDNKLQQHKINQASLH